MKTIACLVVGVCWVLSSTLFAQTLETDATVYSPGDKIELDYAGFKGTRSDWITLVSRDTPDKQWDQWKWCRSTGEGTQIFTAPATPGIYEFRGYFDWDNERPATNVRVRLRIAVDGQALATVRARASSLGALDEEGLASDLMKANPVTVANALRSLNRVDRDDVAAAYLKFANEKHMEFLAGTPEGRELLALMMAELADGWTTDDEVKLRDTALAFLPNDRPKNDEVVQRKKAIQKHTNRAENAIEKRTRAANLDEEGLARDMLTTAATQPNVASAVIDHLGSSDKDDVSVAFVETATPAQLEKLAADKDGRALLMKMVREMNAGTTFPDEKKAMQKVMGVVADANPADMKGKDVDVEVLTFLHGGALDALGQPIGSKGHTAVIVGDMVYSFETGWQAGMSKAEYLAANTGRPGLGQVLKLPQPDAKNILKDLNNAVGTGVYAVGGDICTDASARVLQRTLPALKTTADWNPQRFVGDLHDQVTIKKHNFYPKTSD